MEWWEQIRLIRHRLLSIGQFKVIYKLLQIAIACTALEDVGLDGVFDQEVEHAVSNHQRFMCLNQDTTVTLGVVCRKRGLLL